LVWPWTSRAVNLDKQAIQRRGYAATLRSTQMRKAILFGEWKRIAMTYVEWEGMQSQTVAIS